MAEFLLSIFGKLGYPRLDVPGIIGREKMKESKFYQEILQEGELSAKRADILRVLRVRFGPDATAAFTSTLDEMTDLARLDSLLELAVTCPTAETFRAGLPRQRTAR